MRPLQATLVVGSQRLLWSVDEHLAAHSQVEVACSTDGPEALARILADLRTPLSLPVCGTS
ncbi:MAG: hypothetical protein H6993_00035 [Pseudomonadales bacterium]|nr:hypothetical protein [Pseudomonadales bacterium]MCP5182310.1 hypothetical protein [Pseudomonadales bacterium]